MCSHSDKPFISLSLYLCYSFLLKPTQNFNLLHITSYKWAFCVMLIRSKSQHESLAAFKVINLLQNLIAPLKPRVKFPICRAVEVVKWSTCLPSAPTIRVWILLTATVFFCKICVWTNKNKQKEAGVGPFFKIYNMFQCLSQTGTTLPYVFNVSTSK